MPPKVLVIDDDELALRLFETVIAGLGCDVLSTADGPQGLELFRKKKPDLVVLDLALPTMNGLEVLRELRKLDDHVKIMVVTGYGSDESAEVAARYGVREFIIKPIDRADFSDRINAAFRKTVEH